MEFIQNNITSIVAIIIALISMGVSIYTVNKTKQTKVKELKLSYLLKKKDDIENALNNLNAELYPKGEKDKLYNETSPEERFSDLITEHMIYSDFLEKKLHLILIEPNRLKDIKTLHYTIIKTITTFVEGMICIGDQYNDVTSYK